MIRDLVRIYLNEAKWHRKKLSPEQAVMYFKAMLKKNRIECFYDKECLVGYIESFRLNPSQLRRIICKERWFTLEEDIEHGDILYISDVWIDKRCGKNVGWSLKKQLMDKNRGCSLFAGKEVKRNRRWRIINRVFKKGGTQIGSRKIHDRNSATS